MKKYSYYKKRNIKKGYLKIGGLISIGIGLSFIVFFFFPLISYYVYLSSAFAEGNFEAPIPNRLVLRSNLEFRGLIAQGVSSITTDYTDARNWFPKVSPEGPEGKRIESYGLSIPKLDIENAIVSTTNFDLSKNLVQYFTTSTDPTKNGTSVIYGHSTLPQLFKKGNYKTIFANLHKLKVGDEFLIHKGGADFKYRVFSISVTERDDANIFSQSFDNSYITLVTCTPPGTVWKRLVVRASLVPA